MANPFARPLLFELICTELFGMAIKLCGMLFKMIVNMKQMFASFYSWANLFSPQYIVLIHSMRIEYYTRERMITRAKHIHLFFGHLDNAGLQRDYHWNGDVYWGNGLTNGVWEVLHVVEWMTYCSHSALPKSRIINVDTLNLHLITKKIC